jgi:threonine dehydrogenase-like Zn-dependent dehydrogenase
MLATVMYGPRDVRFEQVGDPKILKATDAFIKLSVACICGSDLWPYRGLQPTEGPAHMGHEYCGIVVEAGSDVRTVRPGQFVMGSFGLSDNTCLHCKFGFHSSCVQREFMTGALAPYARVPLDDGTLVSTAEVQNRNSLRTCWQCRMFSRQAGTPPMPATFGSERLRAMDERRAIKTMLTV